MSNIKVLQQSDFSGGSNDILPADQLGKSESFDLVNLIPGHDGRPLGTRPGIDYLAKNVTASPISGLFRYRRRLGQVRWLISSGSNLSTDTGAPNPYLEKAWDNTAWNLTGKWSIGADSIRSRVANPQWKVTIDAYAKAVLTFTTQVPNQRVSLIFGSPANKVNPLQGIAAYAKLKFDNVAITNGDQLAGTAITTFVPSGADTRYTKVIGAAGTHTLEIVPSYPRQGEGIFDRLVLVGAHILPPENAFQSLHTWATPGLDTRFCSLLDNAFITNGVDKVQRWDGLAGATVDLLDRLSPGPTGEYMVTFRSRVWIADARTSTVYYCATNDEEIPRYSNWSGGLDGDGGNIIVGPDDGENITGLGKLFNSVVVFKSRSTYMWSFGEADSPGKHGRVENLIPGVGCSSHDSIAYYNGALLFLGQNGEGNYGVYRLEGAGVNDLSVKVPGRLQRILAGSKRLPKAIVHDNTYILACDDGSTSDTTRTLVFAFDIRRNAWYEIQGWAVGSLENDGDLGCIYIGDDLEGSIHRYPSGSNDHGDPINYSYKSRIVNGGNALQDSRWRELWVDFVGTSNEKAEIGINLDQGGFSYRQISLAQGSIPYWDDGTWAWDDGTTWPEGTPERRIALPIITKKRARNAQMHVRGATVAGLGIARIGFGFRPRKLTYFPKE